MGDSVCPLDTALAPLPRLPFQEWLPVVIYVMKFSSQDPHFRNNWLGSLERQKFSPQDHF